MGSNEVETRAVRDRRGRPLHTRAAISEGFMGEWEASYPIVSLSVCELRHTTLPRIDLQIISSLDCDPSRMTGPFLRSAAADRAGESVRRPDSFSRAGRYQHGPRPEYAPAGLPDLEGYPVHGAGSAPAGNPTLIIPVHCPTDLPVVIVLSTESRRWAFSDGFFRKEAG
jgi:hypothetical protein